MNKLIRNIVFIATVACFFSCRKPPSFSGYELLTIPESLPVRSVTFVDDSTGIAVGGIRGERGFIYKTTDGGKSWELKHDTLGKNIYDVFFVNQDTIVAGGETLLWLYSFDRGETWKSHWFSHNLPMHDHERPAIKNIRKQNDSTLVFAAGDDFKAGAIFEMFNIHRHWKFQQIDHELKGLSIYGDQITTSGFGYVADYSDTKFTQRDINNDFFVSVHQFDETHLITAGNEKRFYESFDSGVSWEKIKKSGYKKGNQLILDMLFYSSTEGIAIGDKGLLMHTSNKGTDWEEFQLPDKPILYSVTAHNGYLFLCSKQGNIYKINQTTL